MLWPMTKIQKESNSQLILIVTYDLIGVVTYDKDTKRKQFTTIWFLSSYALLVLWPMTKIQKESNSQLFDINFVILFGCCDLWQRYKKKAIHNLVLNQFSIFHGVVTYDKDTKRKQFTTILILSVVRFMVLWPMTKIQKESNSQRWWSQY